MSTRVRVLLKTGAVVMSRGRRAIAEALMLALNSRHIKGTLNQYPGKTKIEKLASLGAKLPPAYQLILFREPKATRQNKSLYWANIRGRVDNHGRPIAVR